MSTDHRSTHIRPDRGNSRDARPIRRGLAALLALLAVTAGASACGSSSATSRATSSQSDSHPKVLKVTFNGDSVSPNGERVSVAVGQKVELRVTADSAGEIHVHSNPEQELAYDQGTSTVEIKPINQPGIVEVESHVLERTIVQLEVH